MATNDEIVKLFKNKKTLMNELCDLPTRIRTASEALSILSHRRIELLDIKELVDNGELYKGSVLVIKGHADGDNFNVYSYAGDINRKANITRLERRDCWIATFITTNPYVTQDIYEACDKELALTQAKNWVAIGILPALEKG